MPPEITLVAAVVGAGLVLGGLLSAFLYYRFRPVAPAQNHWFEARVLTGDEAGPWFVVPAPDFREAASRYFHARSRHKVMLTEVRDDCGKLVEVPVRYECPCGATKGSL